jgi:putative radical SAM enzyme (TIGR03279 family)
MGLEFENSLMDKPRLCKNKCIFCFMDQLPNGLRKSLYLKDDDYRLSFYEGNFITLTNITDDEVERIIEQRLCPLYVAFHAFDSSVRERLLGANHARALEIFGRLIEAGIELHVSIVLVPGINDGTVLDETLNFLAKHRPHVTTVGIVPVAYTKYTKDIAGLAPRSYDDQESAAQVIEQVQSYQFTSRDETEATWVHLADEFYIYARAPFPTSEWYDGYDQYENGIGIVHSYVEDIRAYFNELASAFDSLDDGSEALTVITGELACETMLGTLCAIRSGGKARLLPVENRFLGGNVNVTGLLSGADIVHAIRYDASRLDKPTMYVIPWSIFNDDELTIDGYTPERIASEVENVVLFVSDDAQGLLDAVEEAKR